jgi:L-fucose mutarotase
LPVIRLEGMSIMRALGAALSGTPPEDGVSEAVSRMAVVDDVAKELAIVAGFQQVSTRHRAWGMRLVAPECLVLDERARKAFAVVTTGERPLNSDGLLNNGATPPGEVAQ